MPLENETVLELVVNDRRALVLLDQSEGLTIDSIRVEGLPSYKFAFKPEEAFGSVAEAVAEAVRIAAELISCV